MWVLYLVGGVLIAAKLFFGDDIEERRLLALERRKRAQQREEDIHNLTGTRAFWIAQVGEIGCYHFHGAPKGATYMAQLAEVTAQDQLVLCNENGQEAVCVPMWDVDEYEVYQPDEGV